MVPLDVKKEVRGKAQSYRPAKSVEKEIRSMDVREGKGAVMPATGPAGLEQVTSAIFVAATVESPVRSWTETKQLADTLKTSAIEPPIGAKNPKTARGKTCF